MDVLCTDKTGTLTQGTVRLAGRSTSTARPARACSRPPISTPSTTPASAIRSTTPSSRRARSRRRPPRDSDELPYDFQRRRLSVLVAIGGEPLLLTKGAVESVLAACGPPSWATAAACRWTQALAPIQQPIRGAERAGLSRARRRPQRLDPGVDRSSLADETDLTFLGFLTFRDPPKPASTVRFGELGRRSASHCAWSPATTAWQRPTPPGGRAGRQHLLTGAELREHG